MRVVVRWGLALGAALVLWTLAVHALGWYTTDLAAGQIADRVVIVVPIAAIALALRGRTHSDETPVRFRTALAVGAGVGLVSAAIMTPFLLWYHHVVNPAWLDHLIAFQRARMSAAGATQSQIDIAIDTLRRSGTDSAQVASGVVGSLVLCTLLAVVMWALTRAAASTRSRKARPAA